MKPTLLSPIPFLVRLALALGLFAGFSEPARAQSRQFVRTCITRWNECKSAAFTANRGAVALHGANGFAHSEGIPAQLSQTLSQLNRQDVAIKDVVLTEAGRWLVLYGGNGIMYSTDVPAGLVQSLRSFNQRSEVLWSVGLNDNGEWVVIGAQNVAASSSSLTDYLIGYEKKYGVAQTVHLTNASMVVVYDEGYAYLGSVPARLKTALNGIRHDIYRLKYLEDGSYFVADNNGWFQYYL